MMLYFIILSQDIALYESRCMEISSNRIVVTDDLVRTSDALEQSRAIVLNTHEDVVDSGAWIKIEKFHCLINVL